MKSISKSSQYLSDALYGSINAIIILPVTISFTAIIFTDQIFYDSIPLLIKLVLFSSVIHQIMFSTFSSLPFSVGQVQDAGLIFLSSMAASIVNIEKNKDQIEKIVPTTLVVLSLATFLLGNVLVIAGRYKFARILQYLPMPVIGGYLAFIGFFCGRAGISMMSGISLNSYSDWIQLTNWNSLMLISPGLCLGILMFILCNYYRNPLTLPIFMIVSLSTFYLILVLFNISLETARQHGWIMELSAEGNSTISRLLFCCICLLFV